jgi:hypothetical protein
MKKLRSIIPIVEDVVPANCMGGSTATAGPIASFDPILGKVSKRKKKKRDE